MQSRNSKLLIYAGYVFSFAAYIFMGAVAAHPYDDAVIAQHAELFYYLGTNPLYFLPQGIYWDLINIGSYFPNVILNILGYQNVITIHLATKLFLIISAFISAIYVRKIVEFITKDEKKGTMAFFLFLLNPIVFYTTAMYGSAIIIAVLFIVMATYFIIKKENILGAIFYGLSMGTFIYPLLGIPILFRYVMVKSNPKKSIEFLLVSLLFGAIGQGPIYLVYLLHGSGLTGLPVGSGYLATTGTFPPYSIFDIFNVYPILKFPYLNYLFYSSAIFASLIFFVIPKDRIDNTKLFAFLGIQGVIFSSLAAGGVIMSFPSSIVPFAILFAFSVKRNSIFVPLTISFVTLSLAMETINNVGLPIYFLDINPSLFHHITHFTSTETQLAGFFFGLSILSMLPLFLARGREKERSLKGPVATTAASVSLIIVLLILAVSIFAPVAGHIPGNYDLQNPIGSTGITWNESVNNGMLFLNYTVPLLALTPQQSYKDMAVWLQEPGWYYSSGAYNYTSFLQINGTLSYNYEMGFPSSGGKISIISNSKDIQMQFSNSTSIKSLSPIASDYDSNYLLSYILGNVNGGNYVITLEGNGSVGVFNAPLKHIKNGGENATGLDVDTVHYFYATLPNGKVNGVAVEGGQTVSVPLGAYSYELHFTFHGFNDTVPVPLLVINIHYGAYSLTSLWEGVLVFISMTAFSIFVVILRRR